MNFRANKIRRNSTYFLLDTFSGIPSRISHVCTRTQGEVVFTYISVCSALFI